MGLTRVSVFVRADTELRPHPHFSASGERVAWLGLGDGFDVGVSGSPAAMRRLAAALLASAAAADELSDKPPAGDVALTVAARP
jgi:hypothetical protein